MSSVPAPVGRRQVRVPFTVEITVSSEHNFWSGFTYNVSTGGIFIATDRVLPVGSPVTLELALPPDARVWQITGEVRWIRAGEPSNPDLPGGIGVQFADLPPEVDERIKRFILEKRDSLFYDDEGE